MPDLALLWERLRFGMLLQFAVGPVCLMVLNTSLSAGFLPTLSFIAAVALVDAFYIALSSFGATAILNRPTVKRKAQWVGSLILNDGVSCAASFRSPLCLETQHFSRFPCKIKSHVVCCKKNKCLQGM